MDWLFANPKLLIAAVILCVWAFRLLTQKKPEADQNGSGDNLHPSSQPQIDPAEADRTRRIQEEIRRKIIERQRGSAPPPMPPVQQPVVIVQRDEQAEEQEYDGEGAPPQPPPLPSATPAYSLSAPIQVEADDASATEELLQNQRVLLNRLHALQAERAAGVAGVAMADVALVPTGHALRGSDLRAMLADRTSLRRAILLREILGEPPGLQRGPLVLPRK